jgi:hypothetical protein
MRHRDHDVLSERDRASYRASMAALTCAHAACSCVVDLEHKFCSDSCRRAADVPLRKQSGCGCGHQECLGQAGRKGDEALRAGEFEVPAKVTG